MSRANSVSSLRWYTARQHIVEAVVLGGFTLAIIILYLDRLSYLGRI